MKACERVGGERVGVLFKSVSLNCVFNRGCCSSLYL